MNSPVLIWVYQRLAATGAADVVRYESSIYGPLNAFLTLYFPAHQTFMVKPQAKIRPHYEEGSHDDVATGRDIRASLDSYGAHVLPRTLGGWEDPLKSPDFIVVKPTAGPHKDRVLLVIQVKLKAMSEQHAEEHCWIIWDC